MSFNKKWIFLLIIISMFISSSCQKKDVSKYYEKGLSLYMENKLEESIPYFNRVIKYNKSFKQAYFLKAKALYYQEKYEEANKVLDKVIKKYPFYVDANFLKGKIKFVQKDYELSKNYLLKVIKENSNHFDARILLGDIYSIHNIQDKALLNYSVITSNKEIFAIACLKKAQLFVDLKQYIRALEELKYIENNSNELDINLIEKAYDLTVQISILKED